MRWVVLACVLACACNRILGLSSDVGRTDAAYFDAPLDAAHLCPPYGTVPEYSPIYHEALEQDCDRYSESTDAGLAVATCVESTNYLIYEGPIGGPLVKSVGLPEASSELDIGNVRLSPEGDLLVVEAFDVAATITSYYTFQHTPSGWARGADVNVPQFGTLSVPSRAPDRRILFYGGGSSIQEWREVGTTWSYVRDVAFDQVVREVWLSPDGLRIVATVGLGPTFDMRYTARPSLADDFDPVVPIGLPSTQHFFISGDCTRFYTSSIHAMFYALEK